MRPLGIFVALILITSILTAGALPKAMGSGEGAPNRVYEGDMEEEFEEINEFESPGIWSDRHGVTFKNSTSRNMSTDIDARGDVDIGWEDNRRGNWNIYYVKLDNHDGEKLINDYRVTDNEKKSVNPKIVSYSDNIYVVWEELSDGTWELYFSKLRYSDEEVTSIIERKRVASLGTPGPKEYTFVRGRDTSFHLIYEREKDGRQNIFYRRINGRGENIISPFQITETSNPSYDPKLKLTENGELHLLWLEPIERNNGIFYKKIDYAGNTHVNRKRLTVVNRLDRYALGKDREGNLHMVFDDDRYHEYKRDVIYQKLSSDGKILIDDSVITARDDDTNSFLPSICKGRKGFMYVSWSDSRDYQALEEGKKNLSETPHDIYVQKIDLNGETVRPDRRVTGTFSYSANPILFTDNENQQQLIWGDSRRGVLDIYHKKTVKPDITVNDFDIGPVSPEFNSTVDVTIKLENIGQSSIETNGRLYIGEGRDELINEFNISLPSEAKKTVSFNFTAKRKGEQNLTFVVNEDEEITEKNYDNNLAHSQIFIGYYELSLDMIDEYKSVDPGDGTEFSYSITNDGNVPQDVEMIFESPKKIEVDQDTNKSTLDSGDTERYNFTVNTSAGQIAGEYEIKLIVESLDRAELNLTENFTLNVNPIYDFSLSAEKKSISDPGKMNYTVDLSVTNLANTDQEIFVYVLEGTNYAAVEGGLMTLGPDEEGNAVLNLTNYKSIEAQELEITVMAESMDNGVDNGNLTKTETITIEGEEQKKESSESWLDMIPWFWIGIALAVILGIFVALRIYYTYIS